MGSSPISGIWFAALFLRFLLFLSAASCSLFSSFSSARGVSLPAAPFTSSVSHCPFLTYISSCDTSCTPDMGLPIFFVRPPEFCLSPDREHRLRQAAQRFSPCSIPSPRSFCSLSSSLLSRALLLSSRLLSLIICLLLSLPLLISRSFQPPSSSPPLRPLLHRASTSASASHAGPPNSLSHTFERVAARTDEKHRMEHPNPRRKLSKPPPGKTGSIVIPGPNATPNHPVWSQPLPGQPQLRGHAQRPHQFTPRPRPSARTCPRREARAGTRQRAAAASRAAHAARRAPTRRSRWPPRARCQIGRAT